MVYLIMYRVFHFKMKRPSLSWETLSQFYFKYSLQFTITVQFAKNLLMGSQVAFWAAGKALGGSSNIHGLINIRGNVQGYDLMANRTGDPIWKTSNILKFYEMVENYNGWFDKSNSSDFAVI